MKLLTIGFLAFAAVMLSSQIACAGTRGVGEDINSLSRPLAVCEPLPPATDPDFLTHLTAFMNAFCYKTENWQHDAQVRTSDAVHPYVRLWYSPALYKWMTEGRVTNVPDGAMVVKEQYQSPGTEELFRICCSNYYVEASCTECRTPPWWQSGKRG